MVCFVTIMPIVRIRRTSVNMMRMRMPIATVLVSCKAVATVKSIPVKLVPHVLQMPVAVQGSNAATALVLRHNSVPLNIVTSTVFAPVTKTVLAAIAKVNRMAAD